MGREKVLVAMSGGIDSSVAAHLLKIAGYETSAVTMTLWKKGAADVISSSEAGKGAPSHSEGKRVVAGSGACFSPDEQRDVDKCAEICRKIGIAHTVLDISEEYERAVLENFRSEYKAGRTPNPCVICNEKIKFGAMVDAARSAGLDFDLFATGHYARIIRANGRRAVAVAADKSKDQSYFLCRLSQLQLSFAMFPLGGMTKREVRRIDVELGFHPEWQDESMDFYSGDYSDLLELPPKRGDIVDVDGKVLGHHEGYWNYTIGQRRGLGIGGSAFPLHVLSLDPVRNEVVVGPADMTLSSSLVASGLSFMALGEEEALEMSRSGWTRARAKIRSASAPAACSFRLENGKLHIRFEDPVSSPAPGQSACIYGDDDGILLSGFIESAGRA